MRIVVTGLIAQHPTLGGMTWHYLHYLLGLSRLGHDVFYLEDSGEWPYLLDGASRHDSIDWEGRHNIEYLERTLARFGFEGRWAYHFPTRNRWYGLSGARRREVLASADLLLNVSGSLMRPWLYRQIPRLAYVDTDPTFTQARLQKKHGFLKFQRRVAAHDVHLSYGERLEQMPNPTPYAWIPTRQPVVLDEWKTAAPPGEAFTTIMSWTSFKPLSMGGRKYGQKDVEFQACLDLPRRVAPTVLEVAFSRTEHLTWRSRTGASRDDLAEHGWRTVEATRACADLDSYRRYVQGSKAEWSVAKNGYVVGQPGWFSDRSACYLAAGRPVVVQETGFSEILPVGLGLLSFRTPEEAVTGIREVEANYPRHARAAREIAREYFDSGRVLTALLARIFATTGSAVAPGSARLRPAPSGHRKSRPRR
jgi:hypothetical protein